MTKDECIKEIEECESAIDSLSMLMRDFYGTKDSDIQKNVLIKEYKKRLEKAKKELERIELEEDDLS